MSYDPSEHTIDEVREHLADHPEDTAQVLEAERSRGDDARVTLVSALESASAAEQPTSRDVEDVAVDNTGRPVGVGYPDGEYPETGIFGYVTEETS